jgi:hypothetical protein
MGVEICDGCGKGKIVVTKCDCGEKLCQDCEGHHVCEPE